MTENRAFQLAIVLSIVLHSVLFLRLPGMPFLPNRRPLKSIKISYYKIKELPKKEVARKKVESIVRKLPDIRKEEILKPPKTVAKKAVRPKVRPGRVAATKEVKEKRFEVVIEEEKDDVKRATYIGYYRAVREKIRRYADRNYPRRRGMGHGDVFLSFIVTSSGELLQVKVVEERSVNSPVLRNLAINSIRDASPFPPFPRGMSQYQITFNVIISYESQ